MDLAKLGGGAAAGVAQLLVGHPFDTIKVRVQTSGRGGLSHVFTTLRACYRYEGLRGFYKGYSPQLLGTLTFGTVLFGTYGNLKNTAFSHFSPQWSETLLVAACGIATGVCVSLVNTPVELLKTVQQMHTRRIMSLREALAMTLQQHGPAGLMRGFIPTLGRSVVGNCIYFPIYETVVNYVDNRRCMMDAASPTASFLGGGLAGVCFWTLSYPFDVVKSCMQAPTSQRRGLLAVVGELYCRQGFTAFGRGYAVALLRAFPVNGAGFVAYSRTVALLTGDPEK